MFDPFWIFGLGLASCILLFLWLDRKNRSSESNGTQSAAGETKAPAAQTEAAEKPKTTDSEEAPSDPAAVNSEPDGENVLELTEDGLPKANVRNADPPENAVAAKQINWKRVAVIVGVILVALWKVTVWLLKNSSKLAGNYSGDDVLTRNLQE